MNIAMCMALLPPKRVTVDLYSKYQGVQLCLTHKQRISFFAIFTGRHLTWEDV